MTVRIGHGECHLPFWGRLVDLETVVKVSNTANILHLGNAGKSGPQLFLDGGQFVNLHRTDCCVAWLISPIPGRRAEMSSLNAPGQVPGR